MKNGTARLLKSAALMFSLTLLLNGCAGSTSSRLEPLPRPLLESSRTNAEGGICLDKADTAELLLYIDALERR